MNGFVPGALALVTRCKSAPENIGKSVTLIHQVLPGRSVEAPDGHFWGASQNGLVGWMVESIADDIQCPIAGPVKYAVFAERCLLPLSGDTTQFEQEQREVVHG